MAESELKLVAEFRSKSMLFFAILFYQEFDFSWSSACLLNSVFFFYFNIVGSYKDIYDIAVVVIDSFTPHIF
jgi:hypothetical protein